MNTLNALWVIHTVFVPLQVTTKAGTNPTIYARVKTPTNDPVMLMNDPVTETPINAEDYDDIAIEYAMRAAAEAIRACAIAPGVRTIPASQAGTFLPETGPAPNGRA